MFPALTKRLRYWLRVGDHQAAKRLRSWRPGLYRHLRWPLKKPYQRSALTLLPPGGGLGDELIASGIIAEIKKKNPACRITLLTRRPEYWRGHPLLTEVLPDTAEHRARAILLSVQHQIPTRDNVFQIVGEQVGLHLHTIIPQPPGREPADHIKTALASLAGPFIIIQPETSAWTPNKTWPKESWHTLLPQLLQVAPVVELGNRSVFSFEKTPAGFLSLAGKTSLEDLAWIYRQSRLYVGPDSAGMHLAAAFQLPAAILFGGYTSPSNYPYPSNLPLSIPTDCAPCWLCTPCPYQLKCLHGVSVDRVLETVRQAWK